MTEKNIVFFSNLCSYSNEIIQSLKEKELDKELLLVNIDEDNVQLPQFIRVVPTIFLNKEKTLIIDEEIVKWINKKYEENKKNEDIGGYNSDSFSINFSNLNNSELSNNNDFFSSLNEDSKMNLKQEELEPVKRTMEDYQKQRQLDLTKIFPK
jgi:hypothetical protein